MRLNYNLKLFESCYAVVCKLQLICQIILSSIYANLKITSKIKNNIKGMYLFCSINIRFFAKNVLFCRLYKRKYRNFKEITPICKDILK